MWSQLRGLYAVFRYASPCGQYHAPREIAHGCEEVEVIVSGRGAFTGIDGVIDAGPGSMLWYHEGDIVEVTSDPRDPYETIVFNFVVEDIAVDRQPRHGRWRDPVACAAFCREAFARFHRGDCSMELFCAYHYARLVWEAEQGRLAEPRTPLPLAIQRVRDYIAGHFTEPISLALLAQVGDISASHLHALYKSHTGHSPLQGVIALRIQTARELLVSTSLSVKEISFRTGFPSITHFCRTFRTHVGLTPSAYRQRYNFSLDR